VNIFFIKNKRKELTVLRAKKTKKTQKTTATHELQGLCQPDYEDLVYIALLKKKNNEKNLNVRHEKKRPEVIWTRPSCLKFLQTEDFKSAMKNLEKQGKADFFSTEYNSGKKGYEEKKKANQSKYIWRRKKDKEIRQSKKNKERKRRKN